MNKAKHKNDEAKVYKPEGMRFWGTLVLMGMSATQIVGMIFLFRGLAMPEHIIWLINITIAMLTLTVYFLFIQVAESSLVIYEDGLEWRRGKSYLFAEWKNMRAIVRKNEGDAATYGIQLIKSVDVEINGLLDRFFFGSSTDYIRLTGLVTVPMRWEGFRKGNLIKLEEFAETEFGQDLMHYAPQLFEDEDDEELLEDDIDDADYYDEEIEQQSIRK